MENKIKVKNYGDMLSQVFDMELLKYSECSQYEGNYLAVLNNKGIYNIYMGQYGSCAGCDWLEGECEDIEEEDDNYEYSRGGEIDYKVALDYCKQLVLKFAVPEKLWKTLTDKQKEMFIYKELFYDDDSNEEEMEKLKKEIVKIK